MVQAIQSNTLLSRPTDDIVAEIVGRLTMEVPAIRREEAHADQQEAQVRSRDFADDYGLPGRHPLVMGTMITLHVPYSGNRDFFRVRPTTYDSMPPSAASLLSGFLPSRSLLTRHTARATGTNRFMPCSTRSNGAARETRKSGLAPTPTKRRRRGPTCPVGFTVSSMSSETTSSTATRFGKDIC
jgi:hypothetical protein